MKKMKKKDYRVSWCEVTNNLLKEEKMRKIPESFIKKCIKAHKDVGRSRDFCLGYLWAFHINEQITLLQYESLKDFVKNLYKEVK